MDCLLEPAPGRPSDPAGADVLFRSPGSTPQLDHRRSFGGAAEPCEDCCVEAPRRRTIALAKAILTEACSARLPHAMPSAAAGSPLASVLMLLKSAATAEKACACMATLAFLLLDRSNRKAVSELDCVGAVLEAIRSYPDPQVHLVALDTIVAVVKHDNTEKSRLWMRDEQGTIVSLVNTRLPAAHLLQLLCLLRKAAFRTDAAHSPCELLEPNLVPAVAALLHPSSDAEVLQAALRFLQTAAQCAHPSHLQAWHPAIFGIVPLLQQSSGAPAAACGDTGVPGCPRCTLDAALQPLLSLSDHDAFHNALFAAGCLRPLLPLLSHPADRIKVAVTCILANLIESPLCRQHMASKTALLAMLDSLYVASCTEATVGLLYILGRLAGSQPHVVGLLRHHASMPLSVMMQCNPGDNDVLLGLQQLLELMQSAPADQGASPVSSQDVSRASSRLSEEMSGSQVLRAVDSDMHLSSIAEGRAKHCKGSRALTQTVSSSSIVSLCAINWL